MKRPSFFRGVIVAAVLALAGAIGYAGLSTIIGPALAIRLVTAALGGAYILYLLRGSNDKTGRIAVFTGWITVTSGMWFVGVDLTGVIITQAVLISLVRAFYHHASVLAGLLDLGLSAFALSAAIWASAESQSLFLSVWSFFLVQALFVGIPAELRMTRKPGNPQPVDDRFGRAFRTAETAIKRIATQRY
ncbi:MAG: hypothetical protein ACC642_08725 [Pseudomonadales bacterium]